MSVPKLPITLKQHKACTLRFRAIAGSHESVLPRNLHPHGYGQRKGVRVIFAGNTPAQPSSCTRIPWHHSCTPARECTQIKLMILKWRIYAKNKYCSVVNNDAETREHQSFGALSANSFNTVGQVSDFCWAWRKATSRARFKTSSTHDEPVDSPSSPIAM